MDGAVHCQSETLNRLLPFVNTYPSYEEKRLLASIAEGDEAAFSLLFHACHQKLGAYILRLTGSMTVTEEIVQDVFLTIWQQRSSLKDIQRFEPYLFVIARNRAFNYLKRMARESARKQEWVRFFAQAPDAVNPLNLTDPLPGGYGYDSLIDKAIDQLPAQQKKVYLLHNHERMDHAEIAHHLGLSVTTVKKHMSLALRSIREYISSHIDLAGLLLLFLFN